MGFLWPPAGPLYRRVRSAGGGSAPPSDLLRLRVPLRRGIPRPAGRRHAGLAARPLRSDRSSTILKAMGRALVKKPFAILGTLGTMAAIWWFALRPRLRNRH